MQQHTQEEERTCFCCFRLGLMSVFFRIRCPDKMNIDLNIALPKRTFCWKHFFIYCVRKFIMNVLEMPNIALTFFVHSFIFHLYETFFSRDGYEFLFFISTTCYSTYIALKVLKLLSEFPLRKQNVYHSLSNFSRLKHATIMHFRQITSFTLNNRPHTCIILNNLDSNESNWNKLFLKHLSEVFCL